MMKNKSIIAVEDSLEDSKISDSTIIVELVGVSFRSSLLFNSLVSSDIREGRKVIKTSPRLIGDKHIRLDLSKFNKTNVGLPEIGNGQVEILLSNEQIDHLRKVWKVVNFEIKQIRNVEDFNSLKYVRAKTSGSISRRKHKILSNYQVSSKRELLFVHLLDVFEDSEKGRRWLHEPNGALDNKKPIDFINDLEGIEKVDKILGRIEHGIFS